MIPHGQYLCLLGQIQNHTTQHMIHTDFSHTELFKRSEVKTCFKNVAPSLLIGFHMGLSCGGSRDSGQRREAKSRPSLRAEAAGRSENECRPLQSGHCPCQQCPPRRSLLSASALEMRTGDHLQELAQTVQWRQGESWVRPGLETLSCYSGKRRHRWL